MGDFVAGTATAEADDGCSGVEVGDARQLFGDARRPVHDYADSDSPRSPAESATQVSQRQNSSPSMEYERS